VRIHHHSLVCKKNFHQQLLKVFLWKTYVGPVLTWSNLRKNWLVKWRKYRSKSTAVLSVLIAYRDVLDTGMITLLPVLT